MLHSFVHKNIQFMIQACQKEGCNTEIMGLFLIISNINSIISIDAMTIKTDMDTGQWIGTKALINVGQ